MDAIDPGYATPGLRWSLLLFDHPGASYKAGLVAGTDVDIPPEFGGERQQCKVTIRFPADSALDDVVGFNSVPSSTNRSGQLGNPDDWATLVTKTLGRALKKAGYPDKLDDLKAIILWRRRHAEIALVEAGGPIAALGTGTDDTDFDQAGHTSRADAEADAEQGDPDVDNGPADLHPPDDATMTAIRETLTQLASDRRAKDAQAQSKVMRWCREKGWSPTRPASEAQAQSILDYARAVLADAVEDIVDAETVDDDQGGDATVESQTRDQLALQIGALEPAERARFDQFAGAFLGGTPNGDPRAFVATLAVVELSEAVAWFSDAK